MDTPPVATQLTCTQCGGELHPDEGQSFLTCPYCGSTIYVDKSQVVFHYSLAPTVSEADGRGFLARWMAGNQTVKDLDKKSRVVGTSFEYFPLWVFKRRSTAQEEILLEPAAATSISELKKLILPAGDLQKYNPSLDPQARPPTVPLDASLGWVEARGIPRAEIVERSLVHIPLYTFKYVYQNKPYTAVVEAATGNVFANIFPAKAEAPYRMVGCVVALVYLCLALFPLGGLAFNGTPGATIGLVLCAALGLVAAPFLFALAAWVAARV
jgi:DNA-directed RNA polymerase subunit RPC12/RpoP